MKQVKIAKSKLLNSTGHINIDPLMDLDGDFTIIYGGRYNGKSYDAKRWVINEFMKTGHQFAYIRRWDRDITSTLVNQYFADSDIPTITNGEYNTIRAGKGLIELCNYSFETERYSDKNVCGFYFPINMASRYASTQYPNLYNIIVEEFIPISGTYSPNEMELMFHLFSTLIRERRGRVILIANSISRQSPYWEEFDCTEIIREQELGDINVIERDTKAGKQKIVIHYSRPAMTGNKLFSGKREVMTVEGKWLANPHPHIDNLKQWNPIYSFYVERLNGRFKCTYMVRGLEYTIYVEDYKDKKYPKNARIFSDTFSFSPFQSVGINPLNEREAAILRMIPEKCCYDSDLTGQEFEEIFENFEKNY